MKQKMKQWLGALLSIALILGLMPGMSMTVYADDPYASLVNSTTEITFDGKAWYLIAYDNSTVTLLSKECVGASAYNYSDGESSIYVEYASSTVKRAVDDYYNNIITADAKAAVNGSGMFLLTKDQANNVSTYVLKCSRASGAVSQHWLLCTLGDAGNKVGAVNGDDGKVHGVAYVYSVLGVRPALKLDLSSVIFSSDTNTFTVKSAQTITAADVTAAYGDTDKSVSATTNGGGALSYAVKAGSEDYIEVDATTGALTIKKVGTATVTVTAAETDSYTAATKDVTVTINKAAPTVTAPTAKALTYTGSAQELVTAGSTTGGTMNYALGTDATTVPTSGWSTSIPTGTDAGT